MAQNSSLSNAEYPFLSNGGRMGEQIRAKDWSSTSLGAPGTWPEALKQTVSMMLSTAFPVLICWGQEYLQFYNDAFRPILGKSKHPQALGISGSETFAEIWDTIGPMFEEVMAGKTVGFPNFMVPLERNGFPENCYFDFSYSPLRDTQGHINGVLVICVETTEKVKAIEQAEQAQAETIIERDRLKNFFWQAPAGICILGGAELTFELINPLYQQLFPGRELLGKPLLEAVPEVKDSAIWDVLQGVYTSGKTFEGNELLIPLARTSDGPVEDRYFNFIYQARKDLNGSVDGILVFVIEITDTIRVKRKVEASDKRHNFLLNTMPQQVWTAKPNGELDYVNQVVCDDFGYDTDVIVGKGWQGFVHLDDLTGCQTKWEQSLASGKEYMTEFRLKFSDGNYYWHLARAVPFIEDGVITSWFGTNTNIDSRKANEYKKDEFLSIASHELKTPLTSIKAYNQIMKRLEVPEKVKPFISKSADHIARLERLIADLLDVTKINAGKVSYAMEQFNFAELLNDSVESMKHTAPQHQLILNGNPDITYDGDRGRLEQVINNFISNAVKYSSAGTKVLINSAMDQDNIVVSVQDFGIGIAKENLHKLFDRYYRVDNTSMRFEGLGLGLYISAEILRRHGGSFWIESEVGEGSTFYFRLPIVQTEKQEVTRTATYYRDRYISINYNKMHNRLDVDWTGFHDIESVKRGCLIMWEILEKNKSDRVVNDNTHVLGNWSEAAEWVGNIWFPMMEKAGLKYFALVFSPSTFSQLSAKKSIDIMAGIITTQYFTDIKLAEAWINEQKQIKSI
ncbi:PAS domain S-box-containing protein [Mucilaginibacter lappiensis]|uniref:histidine kinase n=1 Tax=Mucilaginibacter lappiensis TaxID=354630 RepID=A0ABR6PDE5_9SPHI|nr:ATP-binding protein [Mucilaginibacter lappiensis]MBB6107792.1 PAS domain S-box-containing protein [Mucilaginibacter lappiensis]SIP96997.1 PAS domain S-box-containing protein [Mucilaginibacter lappiensis]